MVSHFPRLGNLPVFFISRVLGQEAPPITLSLNEKWDSALPFKTSMDSQSQCHIWGLSLLCRRPSTLGFYVPLFWVIHISRKSCPMALSAATTRLQSLKLSPPPNTRKGTPHRVVPSRPCIRPPLGPHGYYLTPPSS